MENRRLDDERREAVNRKDFADAKRIEDSLKEPRQIVRSLEKLLRQFRDHFLLQFLMQHGVLPSFAFPVNTRQLHNLREELHSDKEPRLKLERDGKLALGDYAPGSEVVAGKRKYQSVGLRKFPAQEFDGRQWFHWCPKCNRLQTWTDLDQPKLEAFCKSCGEQHQPGNTSPKRWLQPEWGYVTDAAEKGKEIRGQRPWKNQTTRSFYASKTADEETPNRLPDFESALSVTYRALAGQTLMVLNLGEFDFDPDTQVGKRDGFKICGRCGKGLFDRKPGDSLKKHKPPYAFSGKASCEPNVGHQFPNVALGHRYETDVLRLDFHGTGHDLVDTGFWLGLGFALANAAATVLHIERQDLEVATHPQDSEQRQAVILYDAVPGGAGHCRNISVRLKDVLVQAREDLADCDCDPQATGCYSCLADYSNQYAHGQLRRGPVLEFLDRFLDQLERGQPDPFRSFSSTAISGMKSDLQSADGTVTVVAPSISSEALPGDGADWYDLLKRHSRRPGMKTRVILGHSPEVRKELLSAIESARLLELQRLGVAIEIAAEPLSQSILRIDSAEPVLWQWPGDNPLDHQTLARRNRLGRFAEALALVTFPNAGSPWKAPSWEDEFRHAKFAPKTPVDLKTLPFFEPIRSGRVVDLLIIDPFICANDRNLDQLMRFLKSWQTFGQANVRVRCGKTKSGFGDFATESMQQTALNRRVTEARNAKWAINFRLEVSSDVYHDRILLWHLREKESESYFRMLLGFGIGAFFEKCPKGSEGVIFGIDAAQFDSEWNAK